MASGLRCYLLSSAPSSSSRRLSATACGEIQHQSCRSKHAHMMACPVRLLSVTEAVALSAVALSAVAISAHCKRVLPYLEERRVRWQVA
jgi:hypothetical protein